MTTETRGKKRAVVVGGGVIGFALLLSWLLGLFPNMGGGDGEGDGDVMVNVEDPDRKTTEEPPPEPQDLIGDIKVLEVLIEDRQYLVREPGADGQYVVRPIETVVELAGQVPGNEDGIKVRIGRRSSARFSTQDELEQRLRQAGISEDAVFVQKEFVD